MPDFFDAIEFAARAHHGQYRKASPLPYILHPLNVARILIECGASDEIVIAAVLHDVIEDTNTTLGEIHAEFGEPVARLVQGMSEPNRQDTWENRKRDTLKYFESASQDLLMIELADKLDNLREIQRDLAREGDAVWTRFNRGRARQKWLFTSFAALFLRRLETDCAAALAREFADKVQTVFGDEPNQ